MADFSNWESGKRTAEDLIDFIKGILAQGETDNRLAIESQFLPLGEAWNQLRQTDAKAIAAKGGVQTYCYLVIGKSYVWVNACYNAWKAREDYIKALAWYDADPSVIRLDKLSGPQFVLDLVKAWRNKDLPAKPPKQRVQSDPVAKAQAEIVALTATVDILRRHKESAEAEAAGYKSEWESAQDWIAKLQAEATETVPMDQWAILCAENQRLKERLANYEPPEPPEPPQGSEAKQATDDSAKAGQGSGAAPRPVWQHTLDKTIDGMVKDGRLSVDGDTIILAQSVPKAPRKRNAKAKVPRGKPLDQLD